MPPPPVLEASDHEVEAFPAPALNEDPNIEYYQEDMGGDMGNDNLHDDPDMDSKMDGGEVRNISILVCVCMFEHLLYQV